MKKLLLASIAVLVVAGAAGGGYYYYTHRQDALTAAKESLSKGDFRSANLQLRTAVQRNPQNPEGHALLAQLELAGDDPIAAEKEVKQAMSLGADRAESLAVLSQSYMLQRKWKEILADIPDQAATKEQTSYFLTARAVALQGLGDTQQAASTLKRAETLAPESAEVHLTEARFALDQKQPDEAMAQLDKTLALDPQRADARALKAQLLAAKNDANGAIAEYDRAVQIAPKRNDILLQRASMLTMANQNARAMADVDELLARKAVTVQAQYLKVILLARDKKFAEAEPYLQAIDTNLSQLPRGLYFKAMVKSEDGHLEQAEDAILTFAGRFPKDADAIRLLGAIELTNKRPDRALPLVSRAVAEGQRDPTTLDLLARLYTMAGKPQEAERVLRDAGATASTPQQLTQLASARLQVGDLSGAAADLQHAVDTGNSTPQAQEALITTAIRLGQLDRAQTALDALRQQTGETEIVGNLTGLLAIARLDPQAALVAFTETANRFPNSVVARVNEARVMLQLGRVDDAIGVLKGMLDKDPAQTDALTLLAQILLQNNRGQEAVEYAEKAHQAKPDDLGLINGEAQLLGRLQQYDRGIQLIESARRNNQVPPSLLATLGSLQLAANKGDDAKASFAALVAAEPTNVAAILGNVDLLTRLKDFTAARRMLDDALVRLPQSLPILQARVRVDLLEQGPDTANQTAQKLRNDPNHMPAAATLVGGVFMGQQRYKDAVAAFQSEYDRQPSSELAVALAEAQQASGDRDAANATLTKFQASHPTDAAVALLLSSLEIASRQLDPAERNLGVVLQQQPNNAAALNNLAWVYQQKGDRRAQETARRAFESAPTPEIADTLGWILVSQGDWQHGLPLLQQASAGNPNNPAMRYHLAVALKNAGKLDDAKATLKPVLEGSAQFDERPVAEKLMGELTQAKP